MRLFGIAFDSLSETQLRLRLERWLTGDQYHRIATVNPEFLVLADTDVLFRNTLRVADLRLVDGFGIVLVAWLKKKAIRRVTGVDLMEMLFSMANERGLSVSLATRADGLSSYAETRDAILKRYPEIRVEEADREITDFKNSRASIILCNFGAPEQEYFLESLRAHKTSFRIAVGVGGAFDYVTGKQKRAPKWMRAIGLEWLWRLVHNPKRIVRVWRATAVFIVRVLWRNRKMKRPLR